MSFCVIRNVETPQSTEPVSFLRSERFARLVLALLSDSLPFTLWSMACGCRIYCSFLAWRARVVWCRRSAVTHCRRSSRLAWYIAGIFKRLLYCPTSLLFLEPSGTVGIDRFLCEVVRGTTSCRMSINHSVPQLNLKPYRHRENPSQPWDENVNKLPRFRYPRPPDSYQKDLT